MWNVAKIKGQMTFDTAWLLPFYCKLLFFLYVIFSRKLADIIYIVKKGI